MQTKALTTDKGVLLELRARDDVVSTAEAHGTEPWKRFSVIWEGAQENQEVEVCMRRDPSDQDVNKISGIVWLDDVALTPVKKTGAKK